MTVGRDQGAAGQHDAQFRRDDMHDALITVGHVKDGQAGGTGGKASSQSRLA